MDLQLVGLSVCRFEKDFTLNQPIHLPIAIGTTNQPIQKTPAPDWGQAFFMWYRNRYL